MKKSILIGVLAVLMLFAFTACEQKTPEFPYTGSDAKDVVSVELADPTSVKAYAGKELSVDTYINIERLDDTVDTVIGKVVSDGKLKTGDNTVKVTWGDESEKNTGKLFVKADELVSLTVEYDATKTVDEDGTSKISDADDAAAGITSVKAYYSDGTEFPISSGYTTKLEGTTFTVSYSVSAYTSQSLTWSTEVVLAPVTPVPDTKPVEGKLVAYLVDNKTSAKKTEYWIEDTVKIAVFKANAAGEAITDQVISDFDLAQNGVLLSDTQKKSSWTISKEAQGTFTVVVEGYDPVDVTIPAGKNWLKTEDTNITAAVALKKVELVAGETTISKNLLEIPSTSLTYAEKDASSNDGVVIKSVAFEGYKIPSDATTWEFTSVLTITRKGVSNDVPFKLSNQAVKNS